MVPRMSLTFYYAPMSTASITELELDELGVPCERVAVDLKAKNPQFLAANPNAKVPVLVHDGVSIWESAAITIYLGEMFGTERKLWPPPGPKRGAAMKWVVWTNVTLGDAVYRMNRNKGNWTPADHQNAKAAAQAEADIQELLGIFDKSLDGHSYVVDNDYTLADTHMQSFIDWLRYQKTDMSKFGNLTAWLARCGERPAYKKMQAAMMAAMAKHGH
jgi:glutathione S-transferase